MWLDERTEFADALSCVANVGNAILGDVIDLGATPTLRDLGNGEPIYLVIQVDTAITGTTSTVQWQLVSDSAAALTTSKTIHADTGAIAEATLVAGYTKVLPLPAEALYERYLGIWQTVAVNNLSAGKVNIFLATDVAKYTNYPDGI
jgi:hypothetical protein